MNASLLRPGDPGWDRTLEAAAHDFYHLAAYVELEAARLGGDPVALLIEDGDHVALLPLVLRPLPPWLAAESPAACDAVSPYGYPAPIFGGRWDGAGGGPSFGTAALAFREALAGIGVVSAFVRLHPLLPPAPACLAPAGDIVEHGEIVWIDLTVPEAELWHQTRLSDRNRISKMRRAGYEARIDERWERFDAFLAVYEATMRRVSATGDYFFGAPYFRRLREALGAGVSLCVVELEGEVTAAGLFTETCGIVQFHLSGTADAHLRMAPTRLMLDHVRRWARARGNRIFHLGGGVGGRADSLLEFKAGFSKLRAPFATWRIVPRPQEYAAALARWASLGGPPAAEPDDFFPAYRRPLP